MVTKGSKSQQLAIQKAKALKAARQEAASLQDRMLDDVEDGLQGLLELSCGKPGDTVDCEAISLSAYLVASLVRSARSVIEMLEK
jgi:hypothetical protein